MSQRSRTDVAIVGMACILPGAGSLREYWENLRDGVDAITDVPPGRWEPEFYDPDSNAVDRIYCNRGGFIDDLSWGDPMRWGLMPLAVQGAEPDQLLVLETVARALADADLTLDELPGERTGITLGRGGYLSTGVRRYSQLSTHAHEFVRCLDALVPGLGPARLEEVKRDFLAGVPDVKGGDVIGIVPNLAASRVANRLDLHGPAYTVDGACASSLLAVDQACTELILGRSDLMLAGGVHVGMGTAFWSVFCQLGALSRSQRIRPFHVEADGLLVGEGVGIAVLKRLDDALNAGDRVYAVIRGCGVASDGREASMMQARPAGQVLAVRRAWEAAGLDPTAPGAVGLVEAHGTATPVGDASEIETLKRVFGPRADGEPLAGLGSVKSMIGHAMAAAGIAGLIKAALAVHHATLPPTLHCEEPLPGVGETRFRIVTRAEPWEGGDGPRRAGVNAFGFGGINAHILLEEAPGGGRRRRRTVPGVVTRSARPEALLISAASREALLEALETGESRLDDGPCRLAILEPTAPLRERARKVVEHGAPFRDRKGHVWFTPAGEVERGGKVAFIFPGLDAGAPTPAWEVAEAFGRPPPTAYDPDDREELGAAIVMAGTVLAEVLAELGVEPDYLAGHSIGEWAAMIAAGCLGREAASVLLADREGSVLEFPDVAFASVGAGAHRIQAVLDRVPGAAIALDNCPHQTVVCGPSEAVREAVARLREGGVLCEELPFRSGFHSTFFADFLDPVRERLHSLELRAPTRPLWSATTCAPFPDDPDAIRALFLEHLVRPVRFRELVEALHADGARVFVQVGGGSLVGFVNDILVGRSHLAMPVLDPRLGGLAQLRRLAAALWVEGLDVDVGRLIDPGVERKARRTGMKLDLSTPLARMSGPLDVGESTLPGLDGAPDDDPVAAEFQATARALEEARRDVLAVWRRRRQAEPPPRPRTRTFRRTLSMELDPGLLDHSLFPTPDGWHRPEDGFPVVPMTMSLDMMMRAARELVPDRVPVAVEKVRAFRWMGVDAPLELDIEARYDGRDLVEVELGPYIHGRVRLADDYPPAPVAAGGPFPGEEAIEESAEEMYARRLMFHGPAYRSVKELVALHADGVRGKLVSLPAQGALLDGAGQVFGYWIKDQAMTDRLAFPVMLESLTVYGPEPPPGTVMDCAVWVRRFGKVQIRADIEVSSNGRVWAFCEGWEDRRLENDEDMWPVIQHPEEHALAEPIPSIPGAAWLRRPIESQWVRDSFARRYMGRAVHEAYKEMAEGRRKIDWHAGRIAAKDAVRHLLWARGEGPIFPVEIDVTNGPRGEPLVACPYVADLRISIAHRDGTAVALVGEGVPVGIDLERIEPRSAGFDDLAFTPEEQAFLPEGDGRDEWRTRLWAAKEAVAKWRGTGLDGDPMGIRIERVEGDRIYCEGRGIDTLREDDWVLAWIIGEDE